MNVTQTQKFDLFPELEQLVPYVSTDLRLVELTAPDAISQDVIREGVTFRRLDADYYVWIEQTIARLQQARAQGRIPAKAYSGLMSRYRIVQKWVEVNVSREVLNAARKRSSLAEYNPPQAARTVKSQPQMRSSGPSEPKPHLFPAEGDWKFTRRVSPEVVAKVDAIRDRALDCGWAEARLYRNRSSLRFPCGSEWGLVCTLDDGETIGEVRRRYIEIITRNDVLQRFYNFNVDQSWIKRAKTSARATAGCLKQPSKRNIKSCR